MSTETLWSIFNTYFSYLVPNVSKYGSIRNDSRSLRIHMKDSSSYIFTYPRNGHYTLVVESVGKAIKEEIGCNTSNQTENS